MKSIFTFQQYVLILATAVAYIALGYYVPRSEFFSLLGFYSMAFVSFIFLLKKQSSNTTALFNIGILFRLLFFFGIPFWSQDFYRFIWDGNLILNGFNPYLNTPNEIIDTTTIFNAKELYQNMGSLSAKHYSNYPPLNQLFFAIASWVGGSSIFVTVLGLKTILLFADIGIYHIGKKVLLLLNQDPNKIFFYFLNPLVIIELTANCHFEGVMLFFFLAGIYFFWQNKHLLAAIFISLSIIAKLLPLLLLPFFYQKLGFKKSFVFYSIILGLSILSFTPFLSEELIANYTKTIGLWFTNFEFNASIYYVIREIGFYYKGYNIIGSVGKITPIVTILVVLFFALVRKNKNLNDFFPNSLVALAIYFFISTTVHPWYAINLILLAVFTNYKFTLIWSYLIVLSYFAYSQTPFKENFILLLIEYGIVFLALIFDLSNIIKFKNGGTFSLESKRTKL
ncbi:MAG: polyprenol phosphomannose-dependent alpha 1,6 mannosyltransferase MptB [Flavobacterium sp.]